jgi:hypothetical protein
MFENRIYPVPDQNLSKVPSKEQNQDVKRIGILKVYIQNSRLSFF